MIKIVFLEAKESDLNALLEIYNFYLRNSTATFDYKEIDINEFKSRISFNIDMYKTFLMNHQDKLTGFCFLTQFKNKPALDRTAEIGIYLYPEFTQKGIGKLAIEFLENYALSTQIKVIISCISGENEASIKLFSKMNYIKCGHFKEIGMKFNRILDVIYYQKILN
ncbi:MAG: N-acetyltransferase [Spirochaetales bacterium]|nr:N-acetyltransferase [Spirochaetales bacterium]